MIQGQICWIGVRPGRREPMQIKSDVLAIAGNGLEGDHYDNRDGGRQATIILAEDLAAAAQALGIEAIDPSMTRRNIVVSGVNLHLPVGTLVQLGECIVELTGPCHPCARMEENLGKGGTKALAHKGGFTAIIRTGGLLQLNDPVFVLTAEPKS